MELKTGHSKTNCKRGLIMKKNVLFLFGGESSEHEVSCISAYNVLKAADTEIYNIYMIGITKDGRWLYYDGDLEKIKNHTWQDFAKYQAVISPCKSDSGIVIFDKEIRKIKIDVCYPVLHGKNGEDGTVQGLLTLAGIPFVGCSYTSSAVCMDKIMAKCVLEVNNIPQTPYIYIKNTQKISYPALVKEIDEKLGFPCFVKPVNAGSSVGASKAEDKYALKASIEEAFRHDSKVMIEKFVNAREIEVAVMGNDMLLTAGPGEILSSSEFYDYETKYNDASVGYGIPADIDEKTKEIILDYARRAYTVLDCKGLSRVDFFIDRDTGVIYLNEINTLPGFTDASMYPKLFMDKGFTYKEIIDELIKTASL